MADYSNLYLYLFNRITDITEILQEVQLKAEEMYVQGEADDNTCKICKKNEEVKLKCCKDNERNI